MSTQAHKDPTSRRILIWYRADGIEYYKPNASSEQMFHAGGKRLAKKEYIVYGIWMLIGLSTCLQPGLQFHSKSP